MKTETCSAASIRPKENNPPPLKAVGDAVIHPRWIYVCHPFENDPQGNIKVVRRICRSLVDDGCLPIAPHLYLPAFLDEATERKLALSFCMELVVVTEELRVYGKEITSGMRQEIGVAEMLGIPVSYRGTEMPS